MHLVCPACGSTNRIPEERLNDGPVCGRCGAALMPLEPIPLDEKTFHRYVANTDLPIVVDFWADWCGPCKMMAPQFAAAAKAMPGVRFVKVDTDENPKIAGEFRIRGIPTLALFQGGKEQARTSGAMGAADLRAWITAQIDRSAE